MAIELLAGEQALDTWTLAYHPTGGGKYVGKLTVTNQRLVFDAKFDGSTAGVLGNRVARGQLEIAKGDIENVEVHKKLLSKKAVITLTDGSRHVFDYGAMSIDKVVAAIQSR